ncbi:MAG: bifunctional (p)ppGpp synthetase/guanosine-3',5'-bis(diphosphate) 3'-pyrophosphohydrolase [Elusimicrobia bacterium]|nr:bifunctional (p)ppGpp synthetase/guanosine-3',5'-bis(diphosphate) 3'-pyrophosphohydrolase [Elusimicrobiota bacterium]
MELAKYFELNPLHKQQITDALSYAEVHLKNLKRLSGRTYFQHALSVAENLAELNFDHVTVISGLLHDVLEDTQIKREDFLKKFGGEITTIVEGVTKIKKYTSVGGNEVSKVHEDARRSENIRKLIIASAKDIRVIFVKLADRMDNLTDLRFLPAEKIKKISQETIDIYAPIAHRLGIYKLKSHLEDFSFMNLNPQLFSELAKKISVREQDEQDILDGIVEIFKKHIHIFNIPYRIKSRPKNVYSVFRKMEKQNKLFEEIQDILGIRIITDTVENCYKILSLLDTIAKPMPETFTDYITHPKSNMYQSIHATVIMPDGVMVEVQIRTEEMHKTASYGIAAHWKYKDREKEREKKQKDFDEKISWIASVIEWQENNNSNEFLAGLKAELEFDQIFVFTPKGDIKSLPAGSTPVDFAYTIHTDIGNRCCGVKVNGKMAPLKYELHNGESVEILTSKVAHPSQDWLKFVKTPLAKSKIKNYNKLKLKPQIVTEFH